MTSKHNKPLPFVLRALCLQDGEQPLNADSPPTITEVTRLKDKKFCIIRAIPWNPHNLDPELYAGHLEYWAATSPATPTTSGERTSPRIKERLRNVVELDDAEVVKQFQRIYSGDFPWADLNTRITSGFKTGALSKADLDFWDKSVEGYQEYDEVSEQKGSVTVANARAAVNDLLLWMLAVDLVWGFEGSDEVLKKLGKRNLTLGYYMAPLLYEVKVVVDNSVTRWRKNCWICGSMYLEDVHNVEAAGACSREEKGEKKY
ncbi:uncharacterized protein L3040_005116 [Drepanopeziza brunnea f. sp. 'multigermtubi']|nr:hypothetical protein L3040_005116 [Drepanopeziza brunnea f. sp. 'multigermtubi']